MLYNSFYPFSLRLLYPVGLLVTKILRLDQDVLKRFFIKINNRISFCRLKGISIDKEKILVILPHCLQDSECDYRITGSKISNCRDCGKCLISEIKKMQKELSLNMEVSTGGQAARNIIKEIKPGVIFAIACENDLASGIYDVTSIPVIGLLNSRPDGPCKNTVIDLNEFKRTVGLLLHKNC